VGAALSPYVHYDGEALTADLYAFVTEPRATVRNAMPIAEEARDSPRFPIPFEVMETMVLDGVEDSQGVADLVDYATRFAPPEGER